LTLTFLWFVFLPKPYSQMGNKRWNSLEAPESVLFPWDLKSTYIRCPSFFDKLVSTVLLCDLLNLIIDKKTLGRVQCFALLPCRPKSQLHSSLLKMPMSYYTWEIRSRQTIYHLLEVLLGVVLLLSI
jgi:hypothetical protein